ncbi:MAG: hypothetical protein FRX48_09000 [Lasallia pustulata]|uniref:Uncharacterized protein n=1 Tax=Lasallia pustulata TaxID=136370 RepID=A0A5M8PE38_9LECA|nr:MAG: hypothetical protein FRX48_09000 [Lasallia pustulata]
MADTDDDEELRRAIALSLAEQEIDSNGSMGQRQQPSQVPIKATDIVDLLSDDESQIPRKEISTVRSHSLASGQSSLLGLNRKEMEERRLARKRKVSISPPPPRKVAKSSKSVADLPQPSPPGTAIASIVNQLQFPNGTVKKTWAFGHPRDEDIKIEEVLQRADLTLAVLSSFQWDVEWLLGKLSASSTKMIFVMQAKEAAAKHQYARETASMPNLRLCFPNMDGQINCMHSKLMLLAHPSYLRIVVPTANLVPYDWGEGGVMENMVFLIDLPRLAADHQVLPEHLTFFGRELIHFIRAMGLHEDVVQSVYSFDFSATDGLAFVHTIGGAHSGDAELWRRTGYCGLGRAVRELGLGSDKPLEVDFVTSSIGSLNMDFITTMYLAATGDDGLMEYEWRTGKQRTTKGSRADGAENMTLKEQTLTSIDRGFRIYFPTHDTVVTSKEGATCGGTICFQAKWYSAATFPRTLLRDCQSQRKGMLMHNKILFVRAKEAASAEARSGTGAWAYVGSANCSESAWGKLVKDRTSKTPKLNCRNWECGVLLRLTRRQAQNSSPGYPGKITGLEIFKGLLPVPMQYPGEEYGSRKPWFYSEQ